MFLFAAIATLTLHPIGLLRALPRHAAEPRWLDHSICNYVFEKQVVTLARDKRTGYFLLRFGECDWGMVSMVLTRDRKLVADSDVTSKQTETVLQHLSTGKGVKIGDTPRRLTALLGPPTHVDRDGDRDQFKVFKYEWKHRVSKDEVRDYSQEYTFKNGRLIQIQFFLDNGG